MDRFIKLEKELYDRLIKWVKKGANRKRKCCKKHSLACKRFLRFLEGFYKQFAVFPAWA